MLGFAELLEETTLDQQQRSYLSTMQASASSLMSVINDLLDFSKIEVCKEFQPLLYTTIVLNFADHLDTVYANSLMLMLYLYRKLIWCISVFFQTHCFGMIVWFSFI